MDGKDRKSIAITPCAAEHPMSFKVPDRLLTDGQCRMMINGIQFIYLRRNWGGEYENVSVLVAMDKSKQTHGGSHKGNPP